MSSRAQSAPRLSLDGQTATPRFFGHVLLVEDNPVSALIAQTELQNRALLVSHAFSGRTALGMFLGRQFDLVLMDCEMPELDGYETTKHIRRIERIEGRLRVPVIALTAHARRENHEACLACGMDGHLGKPIVQDALAKTLSSFLVQRPAGS